MESGTFLGLDTYPQIGHKTFHDYTGCGVKTCHYLYKIVITIACIHFPYSYLKTYKLSLILIISQFDTFWDIESVNTGISMSSEVFGLVHIFIIW